MVLKKRAPGWVPADRPRDRHGGGLLQMESVNHAMACLRRWGVLPLACPRAPGFTAVSPRCDDGRALGKKRAVLLFNPHAIRLNGHKNTLNNEFKKS